MQEVAEQQFKARVRKGLCIVIAKPPPTLCYASLQATQANASRRGLMADVPCFI